MSAWTEMAPWAVDRELDGPRPDPPAHIVDLARRVDWRFLLPDPSLERVAYAGPPNGLLAEALRRFAKDFVPVGAGAALPHGDEGDCDLAVVASRRVRDLRAGLAHVRPGGHVYWELNRLPYIFGRGFSRRRTGVRGPRAGGFLRDPQRVLEELGLEEIRVHCDFPHLRRPKVILSPDPAAIRYVTEMRGKKFFGIERCLEWVARMGALPRIAPWVGVVARRPGGDGSEGGVSASTFLGRRVAGWELDRVPWVLLAPPLSWFVITIFLVPGSGRPLAVVKAIRVPGDPKAGEAMDRETRGLRFAEEARLPDPGSVPMLMACGKHGGTRSLAQSAALGRVLSRREVRRRPEHWTGKVVEWLTEVHRATRHENAGQTWRIENLVEQPLEELRPHLPQDRTSATLISRTLRITRSLARTPPPFVLEHGDLWGSNILVGREDRISVVDWEWAEPHGLPGRDLFFFLAFVAMTRERAVTPAARLEAFRRAFRGPDGWARHWISEYWRELDLPREAAGPLFVACWSRHVRRLVRRPDGILAGKPSEELGPDLRRHHYFRFWKEILGPPGSLDEPYANLTIAGEPR